MTDEPTCGTCGKKMITTGTGLALMTYPPQYPMQWWCACGHTEPAETIKGKTEEELRKQQWEAING